MPPEPTTAPRNNRKCVWRSSSAAAGPSRAAVAVESTKSVNTNVAVTDADTQPPPPSLQQHKALSLALNWGEGHFNELQPFLMQSGGIRKSKDRYPRTRAQNDHERVIPYRRQGGVREGDSTRRFENFASPRACETIAWRVARSERTLR